MVTEESYLAAKKVIAAYEREQLNKANVSSNVDTGGIYSFTKSFE